MEWIDSWHCKSCGAINSESRDVCHKCGHRRRRLLKPAMVPWIVAAFFLTLVGAVKVYVDKSVDAPHNEEGQHSEFDP